MNSVSTFPDHTAHAPVDKLISSSTPIGSWSGNSSPFEVEQLPLLLRRLDKPVFVLNRNGHYLVSNEGSVQLGQEVASHNAIPVAAWLPPQQAARLGDLSFCRDYAIRLPYMTGAMANGIA